MSLSQKVILHILNCTTAKDMWDKLHTVFEQNHDTGKHYLQQQFFLFTKDPRDDIATHISKMEDLVRKLKDLDVVINDGMVITKILMTLPHGYKHFTSA